jgi:DNA-binding response OmpR family regulator
VTRLLLVEDDPTIAETLRYALERSGYETALAMDGLTAEREARRLDPDLVLLDLMLPDVDGFEVCRRMRAHRPDLPIIIVTALDDEDSLLAGFEAGADDYVTKPFSIKVLLARIKANLRRSGEAMPEVLEVADLRIDTRSHTLSVAGLPATLRPKEFDLLVLMVSNPGALLTRQRIGAAVWGYESLFSSRTIDTHVLNLRRKVESVSAYRLIETAHGLGYRFNPRPKAETEEGDAEGRVDR